MPHSSLRSRCQWLVVGSSLGALLAGCYGTEVPPQKPDENPLAGLPPPKPTADATKVEDKPNDRKPTKPDEQLTSEALARATRQAAQCAQINTEGPFGDFSFTVVLSETGKVAEARLPPELAGKPIGNCVKKAYESEIIPPWQGTPINRTVSLTLKAPAAPAPADTKGGSKGK